MSAEVIHGNCLDVMRGMPDASVDAVITDPPYGIQDAPNKTPDRKGKRAGRVNTWHAASHWDASINPEWCREAGRVAPLVVWFGNWRKREEVEAAMPHPLRCEIIWAKNTHVGPPCPVSMQDERIWVFAAEAIKIREFATTVWSVPIIPTWARREHRNEKPVALMAKAVRVFTDPGALVLDPFAGSGTTGVACVNEGRRCVLVEREAEHVATTRRRIAAVQAQTLLGVA
jgi:DNA modification methylase